MIKLILLERKSKEKGAKNKVFGKERRTSV